jgi:hypothetical protein
VKKTVWLSIIFAGLVLGYVLVSSFSRPKFRCQVCMVFNGRRDCRTASAETRENALRTAITNACAELAGGRSETNECENTKPESINWLQQ